MDRFDKSVRSRIMSKIRSKWTKPEKFVHNWLKGHKVRHRMHSGSIYGNPDIFLTDYNTVVFVDGCFWHKCPLHFRMPKSNVEFWRKKIQRNVERDNEVSLRLSPEYNVVRVYECNISAEFLKNLMDKIGGLCENNKD